MKSLFHIACLIFTLAITAKAQNTYDLYESKYKAAYSYLDSIEYRQLKTHLNISFTLGYLSPIYFDQEIHNIDTTFQIESEYSYHQKLYFSEFYEEKIKTIYEGSNKNQRYIIFSKPFNNFLLAEVRYGIAISKDTIYMPLNPFKVIEFGTVWTYLFQFDDNKVVKTFCKEIMVN